MNNLITLDNFQVSELNAFELEIQGHERALDFIPDMDSAEGRNASSEALKAARKTFKLVDAVRLEKKKEAETVAKAIHEKGKSVLGRLEASYTPHKEALDEYKAIIKRAEEARVALFYDACQWLNDVEAACQFESAESITRFVEIVTGKDCDNTGLSLTDNERLEYGKIRMRVLVRLDQSLTQRVIKDAEEERQKEAAFQLEQQREEMRQEQERMNAELEQQREAMRQEQAAHNISIAAQNAERDKAAAVEQAAQAERDKFERIKQVEAEEELARMQDEAHIGSIFEAAVRSLIDNGVGIKTANKVIDLIGRNRIPRVSIEY